MLISRLTMSLMFSMLVGCGGGSEGVTDGGATSSEQNFTYRAITKTDTDNVQTMWAARDLSVKELSLAYEDSQPDYNLKIFKHRIGSNIHYGAIISPANNSASKLPVLVLADGLNQADPSAVLENSLQGYKGDAVLVVPAYRGRTLRYKNQGFSADGDFCDAYDGATDDTIAMINVLAATTPIAKVDKIMVAGYSRGGNVALLLAERDARINTVVAGAGPVDFYRQSVQDLYSTQYDCQFLVGKTTEQSRERMLASSPLYFPVLPSVKKVYLLQGAADMVVPPWNAREMNNHLIEQKVDVSLYIYDGYGHGDIWNNQNFSNTWTQLHADFIAAQSVD